LGDQTFRNIIYLPSIAYTWNKKDINKI